ncbi:hypothetical protein BG006_009644 [Podila minutissima]|uniref:Uncharacterized protein n=1 Tax=Podila minutissima TaxID=64525 RepID=A0A9P5VIS8_9FUNG|nr:hypothetical protein BG006_009644 [Podila minutissima]
MASEDLNDDSWESGIPQDRRKFQQTYPYIPPPNNFPPDKWGNSIPDFSQVGYRSGNVPLPTVPVKVTLRPSADPTVDDRLRIQTAIDYVGRQPLTPLRLRDGSTIMARGAVLLQAGFYRVAGSLILKDSGVVLRGEGNRANGTIVIATGDFRHDFIFLHGLLDPSFQGTPQYLTQYGNSKEITPQNALVVRKEQMSPVADEYVPAGTRRVPVKDIQRFRVGQSVVVERDAKDSWVDRLGTSHIPKRPADPSRTMNWDPRQFTLRYMRTVTGIEGRDREAAKEAARFAKQHGAQIFMAKSNQQKGVPRLKRKGLGPRRKRAELEDGNADVERRLAGLQESAIDPERLERIDREQREYLGGSPPLPGSTAPGFSRVADQNRFSAIFDDVKNQTSTESARGGEDDEEEEEEEDDEQPAEDDPRWVPGYLIIDIPLTMNLDPIYGGGSVYNLERETPIPQDIGVENMALWSEHSPTNPEDERHAWFAVMIDHCEHCWATDIRTRYFASGIKAASGSKHVTIQDCSIMEPVSLRSEGGRRYMYMLQGQMGLVKRCFASDSRHDFMTGAKTSGPNVFVDSVGIRANNDAGPHDRWATGSLYDNIRSHSLNVRNRGWMGSGQGWAGVFHVIFRCASNTTATFQSPPGGTNWVIGFRGHIGEADIQFPGDKATILMPDVADLAKIPRSLYWAQLVARAGGNDAAAQRLEGLVGIAGKNKYPAPLARQFATAGVVQANEAGQWPNWTNEKHRPSTLRSKLPPVGT